MHRLYAIVLLAVGLMSLLAVAIPSPEPDVAVASADAADQKADRPVGESDALLLKRDSSGQFHVNAGVNGNDVRFLVDTGADMVALTEDEADALGLTYGEFQPIMQTASGVGYGAPVMLDEIEVAGTQLHDVDAVVVQGLNVNLLGQTVLRKLGGVSLNGDRMVIRPR